MGFSELGLTHHHRSYDHEHAARLREPRIRHTAPAPGKGHVTLHGFMGPNLARDDMDLSGKADIELPAKAAKFLPWYKDQAVKAKQPRKRQQDQPQHAK